MNKMKKAIQSLQAMLAMLALMCVSLVSFTACSDDDDEYEILKPISEHLIGRWMDVDGYMVDENGNKIEDEKNGLHGYVMIRDLQPDGRSILINTTPEGWQRMTTAAWKVDQEETGYHIMMDGTDYFFPIHKLTADYLITSTNSAYDETTGQIVEGAFRFEHRKVPDEPTLAERLVGMWRFENTYEKVNGEWRVKNYNYSLEAWREFKDNGRVAGEQTYADQTEEYECDWKINTRTGELSMYDEYQDVTGRLELVDDDTMLLYYNEDRDFVTGEVSFGEFKDLMIRVK